MFVHAWRRAADGMERWGSALSGDRRVVPAASAVGAGFFLLLWATQARVLGSAALDPAAILAGVLAFAALWASFGILAVSGLARVAYAAVLGHLVGYVVLTANLVTAVRDGTDTLFAVVALFGCTLLGLLAGFPLEWWARRARRV